MRRCIPFLAWLLLATPAAAADGLLPLPASDTFVLVADVRQLGAHGFGALVDALDVAPGADVLESEGHVQLSRDLRRVVLAGSYVPDSGVAYCEGSFDAAALENLAAQAPDAGEQVYQGHRIETWTGADGKPGAGCVVSASLVLLARAAPPIQHALDALDGRGAVLAATSPLAQALPSPAGALVVGAGVQLDQLPAQAPRSRIAKSLSAIAIEVLPQGRQLVATLTGTAASPPVANQLARLLNGLAALAQLNTSQPPAHPVLQLLLDGLQVSASGSQVVVRTSVNVDALTAAIRERLGEAHPHPSTPKP